MKAKRTRFAKPYKKTKGGTYFRTNLPLLDHKKDQAGVYFIKKIGSPKILYVGYSENSLYKTIYRHFQKWIDISREKKTRFTYPKDGYMVKIIFTDKDKAAMLEKHFIRKLKPRDNNFKYEMYFDDEQDKAAEKAAKEIEDIGISDYKGDAPF